MQVGTRNKGLGKALEDDREATKQFGSQMAKQIKKRIMALTAANSLADFWPPKSGPERCHELSGNMSGIFSMDLNQPYRLLFKASDEPMDDPPENAITDYDNKERWKQIRAVEILEIKNTHG